MLHRNAADGKQKWHPPMQCNAPTRIVEAAKRMGSGSAPGVTFVGSVAKALKAGLFRPECLENIAMRRLLMTVGIAAALGGPLASVPAAFAATETPFTEAAFTQAQAQGKPILVDITATWCPVCAKQRPILDKLAADPAFSDLHILKVDFDSQKDVVRAMGVQMQSTLIVYHGKDERGRSTGQTDAAAIRALLDKSKT